MASKLLQMANAVKEPVVHVAKSYSRIAEKRPVAVGMVTTLVKTSAADLFAQKVRCSCSQPWLKRSLGDAFWVVASAQVNQAGRSSLRLRPSSATLCDWWHGLTAAAVLAQQQLLPFEVFHIAVVLIPVRCVCSIRCSPLAPLSCRDHQRASPACEQRFEAASASGVAPPQVTRASDAVQEGDCFAGIRARAAAAFVYRCNVAHQFCCRR